MTSVTADTNIYISALNFGGTPLRLLDVARAGRIRLDISEPILAEVARVLATKFQWEPARVKEAESLITGFTRRVAPTQTLDVIQHDPPDNRILECAAEATSDCPWHRGQRDLRRYPRATSRSRSRRGLRQYAMVFAHPSRQS